MERIKLQVLGSQIEVLERPAVITAGTVGLEAEFTFDSQWVSLTKTAVFRAGDTVIATTLDGNVHIVPWEVLEKPDMWLSIGVYGANAEGTMVIPTLWTKVAAVYTGTDPEGDPALEPSNPIWQEALARVDNIKPQLQDHIQNSDNPHGVTCDQIGAVSGSALDCVVEDLVGRICATDDWGIEVDARMLQLQTTVDSHKADTNNPHQVTCEQIGATPKELYAWYTQITDGDITDIWTRLIDAELLQEDHFVDKCNPHNVTCEQIGAATKEELQTALGDVESALDGILAIQNELIGGDSV